MFSKKIIRHDGNPEYRALLFQAQKLYPNDIIKQLEFFKEQPSQYKLLGKLDLIQLYLSCNYDKKVELSSNTLEFTFRGLMDMARHMQDKLPDGVYDYINSRLESLIRQTAEQIEGIEILWKNISKA